MPRRANVANGDLERLIKRDLGVVTLAELRALGLSLSTAVRRTRPEGPWQRLLPGTILTYTGAPTPRQRITAAMKYAHEKAVITGRRALRAYGLKSVSDDGMVHVLVPHARRRISRGFVIVERTTRMPTATVVDGVPCAPVARALVDACRRSESRDEVRELVAEAVQTGKCTPAEIAAELAACQRRGSALPRLVLKEIAAGIRSAAEAKLRELILRSGLPEPLWNPDLFAPDGTFIGRPDAYWEHLGIALQIDSMAWHLNPAGYRRTQDRQRELTKHAILVIPIAPTDLLNNAEAVIAQIQHTMAAATERPTPKVIIRPRVR